MRTIYDKDKGSLTGYCHVPDSSGEREVIKFILGDYGWTVGCSTCLPVRLNQAKAVQECVASTFERLDEIINKEV